MLLKFVFGLVVVLADARSRPDDSPVMKSMEDAVSHTKNVTDDAKSIYGKIDDFLNRESSATRDERSAYQFDRSKRSGNSVSNKSTNKDEADNSKKGDEGKNSKKTDEGESSKKTDEGESSKKTDEGDSSKKTDEGDSSKKTDEGDSSKKTDEGDSSKKTDEGESSKKTDEGESSEKKNGGEDKKGKKSECEDYCMNSEGKFDCCIKQFLQE